MPVQTFVEDLEAGDPLDDFVIDFPSVTREQAVAVLELAKDLLLARAVAYCASCLMSVYRVVFRAVPPGLPVSTAREQGWNSLRNGKLLAAMRAAGYTTLVTVDRNLTFQQHIAASGIAVIVMHAIINRLPDLVPLGPLVVEAIAATPVGAIARVSV